jgi:hypothetical protein
MVPAIAPQTPTTLRIVPTNLRSARGHYTGGCLVFAGETCVKSFATIAAAKRFVAQSQAVA